MTIDVVTVPHEDQRYNTVGDWRILGDTIVVTVSETGEYSMNFLIALHELIEAMLCKAYMVSEKSVDQFDMSHPELDDPGDDPRAPYHRQHIIASAVERMIASFLDVDWSSYENTLEELCQTTSVATDAPQQS